MEGYSNVWVKKLPSGFWSVWVNGDWINAALPNQEAAEKLANETRGKYE